MARIRPPKFKFPTHGYVIEEKLESGMFAITYKAKSPDGRTFVFLKQYKSPCCKNEWYKGFIEHQRALQRQIENTTASSFCYRFVSVFEDGTAAHRELFQVFEWVEGGLSLEDALHKSGKLKKAVTWEQKVIFAKVVAASISCLHKSGIVHADLKPPNIIMFPDSSIEAGFRPRLIDMDFSVLIGKTPPWHGHIGYVGSPNYLSPEHLRGEIPGPASDVFTLCLILCELLCEKHPYAHTDEEEYRKKALGSPEVSLRLAQRLPAPVDSGLVEDLLRHGLSPHAAQRPTAKQLHDALIGRPVDFAPSPAPVAPSGPPAPPKPPVPPRKSRPVVIHADPPPPPPPPPTSRRRLVLVSESGLKLAPIRMRTEIGRDLVRGFGEDSVHFDRPQFIVQPADSSGWEIVPCPGTRNETHLNGRAITSPQPLAEGDVIGVGREAKGITKLPMKAQFVD